MSKEKVNIKSSKDEAIVLFEFLSGFLETDKMRIEHQAEERVLWDLTCAFEKELAEPFAENYDVILKEAREKLKDKDE